MSEIQLLPEEVISKIAAGEVIERPASVLKELLENAVDAGATRITVDIKKAGKRLIRVNDDGKGMDLEDLKLSVGRHATSKIRTFEDLDAIATFGFRGEALYSIFAVSKLAITSFRPGAETGHSISGEGGRLLSEAKTPPVKGTTVEVSDLFFNTPARAKFMKSEPSERAHLIRTVEEAALANLNTGFTLAIDGTEIFSLPPGGEDFWAALKDRAGVILGKNIHQGLIKVEGRNPAISIYGLISRPDSLSATRLNQLFFVNKRPVTSRVAQQALYRGYDTMRGDKHPACVLFLDLDPADFDVNIHPQKKDVKFASEGEIFRKISSTVYNELLKKQTASVALTEPAAGGASGAAEPGAGQSGETSVQGPDLFSRETLQLEPCSQENGETPNWYLPPISYLGQIAKSYLLFESGGGLLVMDQHAAQERILFEKYLEEFSSGSIKVQPLMLPVSVELPRSQIETVLKWKDWLDKAGFEIERFGAATLRLHSTPALFYFTPEALSEFLGYMAQVLGEPEKASEDLKRNTVATMACKKSVKAHDYIKPPEALRLITDLKGTRDSFHCPHGRPTLFYISPSEIARKFQRTNII
ncbi:MAG: DNA mismatch repair endonuclease MutL [Elusimicrobiales bacterium]|jgi:DNA mismatch repair protein MutL